MVPWWTRRSTAATAVVSSGSDGNAEPAETLPLRLSNAEGATLATTEASGTSGASGGADTFTGAFSAVPSEHDGTNEFTLTLTFDEEPEGLSYKTVRDSLFTRAGGTIEGARRLSPPSNQAFVLKVASSISTRSSSRLRSGSTMARRSLCSRSQALL